MLYINYISIKLEKNKLLGFSYKYMCQSIHIINTQLQVISWRKSTKPLK